MDDAIKNISIKDFQELIHSRFYEPDSKRGTPATFMWFMEEVGELATALVSGTSEEKAGEFADVLGWLCTLANINDIDLTQAINDKYIENEQTGYK